MAVASVPALTLTLTLLGCLLATVAVVHRLLLPAWWTARRQGRMIRRLDRSLEPADSLLREAGLLDLDRADRPAIEKVAADLRRLGAQRLGVATRSHVWHRAVLQAYDDRLRLACRCLGVTEHLTGLAGLDLAIERLRIEGELQAAGLVLPAPAPRRKG